MSEKPTTRLGANKMDKMDYKDYYKTVLRDFNELKEEYPFSELCIPPTCLPSLARIDVIAVDTDTIAITRGGIEDFVGRYNRKLRVEVPLDYQNKGCLVFGGKWIEKKLVKSQFWHFNGPDDNDGNHLFCVGVPASFISMDNVILECVRTADNMLTAYRKYMTGKSKTLELNAYSHGSKGEKEYEKERRRGILPSSRGTCE